MANYQIVEAYPRHCSITDGIIGTDYKRHPMTYFTLRGAKAIAGMKERANYDSCGDSHFFVIDAGAPVLTCLGRPNVALDMEAGGPFPIADSFDEVPF